MKQFLPLIVLGLGLSAAAQEGSLPTQLLVTTDTKDAPLIKVSDLTIEVHGKKEPPTTVERVAPNGVQIALLIDDGLRESVGRELNTLRSFVTNLPPGSEIFIGYMTNGSVRQETYFTTDHAAAAARLRLPLGSPGVSASPYFCLSQFVQHWPTEGFDTAAARKARFVLMITNGVDPYNGSTSPLNQDSPYVAAAERDAQRVGVSVSSIYFADAGMRGGQANFSGQSYLGQVAEATGGRAYYQGIGNPVSLEPYLKQFQHDISETYITTFPAAGKDLVDVRVKTNVPHLKVRAAQQVRPGNVEASGGA